MELLDKTEEVRKLERTERRTRNDISTLHRQEYRKFFNIDKPPDHKNEVDKFVSEDGQKKDDIDSTQEISQGSKDDERNSRASIEKSEDDIEERIFEMF